MQKVGNLEICIYENRVSLGQDAADMVCKKINELLKIKGFVNVIFASAPSQHEFLDALTKNTSVNWGKVNAFHMDEYIELPENDPATFASFLRANIFGKLPFNSINYMNGNAPEIGVECRRYTKLLIQYPPDIVCLGIGENGHLAFNDPHVADFHDPSVVKMIKLDAESRQQQVNDKCFAYLSQVPTYAITLTIPALMAGKFVYCMVPGEKKANAVYNTLNKEITEKYPATILREHHNAILFLDKDSSSLL